MESNYKRLGEYIEQVDVKNSDLTVELLLGVSIEKKFIASHANTVGTDFSKYKVVKKGQFAYGPVTSRNGNKISIALLKETDSCLVSSSYIPFEIIKPKDLDADYLMLLFSNPEFDRYARYNSWGSAREVFSWNDFCDSMLYIPDIKKQKEIVARHNSIKKYCEEKKAENTILEKLADTLYIQLLNDCSEWDNIILGKETKISAGGDNPKDSVDKKTDKCQIPIYSNGTSNDGLFGYTSKAKINEPSITISARGELGYTVLHKEPYTPIVRLISIVPNNQEMLEFLFLHFKHKTLDESGSAQKQATKPYFEAMEIAIPSTTELKVFRKKVIPILDCIQRNKRYINELNELDKLLCKMI